MTDLETRTAPEAVKEPAKRWRNWWRSVSLREKARCDICGVTFVIVPKSTFTFDHCRPFPSQAEAEANAAEMDDPDLHSLMLYLGAFPEGQTP